MPIERAEPSMIFDACSIELALRSFIFDCAISSSCERLIVPAEVLPGSFEPDLRFSACLMKNVAGGVLVMN